MSRKPKLSDEDFATLYQAKGPGAVSDALGCSIRHVHTLRQEVENRLGVRLMAPNTSIKEDPLPPSEARVEIDDFTDGVVLVGSDAHYWPGYKSTAHRAFVKFAKDLKPDIIVLNGDALDAPSISRHPPIGWEDAPTLDREIELVQERLGEIAANAGRAQLIWPLGNHDARFNTRLAMAAPEYRNVEGTRLVHHFPEWRPCWSVAIGGVNGAIIKHRFKGGIHATHNNTLWGGRSIVTGHLHSLKVTPFTDYNGTRFGVDCGTLAYPRGPQFRYTEDNPLNWRSGFVVLTWRKGRLLWPEIVAVADEKAGEVEWRGSLITV